jgi:hypothetical protein
MALVTLGLVWYFWTEGTLGRDYGGSYDGERYGSYGGTDYGYTGGTVYGGGYDVVVVRRLKKTVEIIGYELTVGEFVAILVMIVGIVVQVILNRLASAEVLPHKRQ